jgi:hypothetical protein
VGAQVETYLSGSAAGEQVICQSDVVSQLQAVIVQNEIHSLRLSILK